ncbi:unnamed protein product [Arabidopsis halleri]
MSRFDAGIIMKRYEEQRWNLMENKKREEIASLPQDLDTEL